MISHLILQQWPHKQVPAKSTIKQQLVITLLWAVGIEVENMTPKSSNPWFS